MTDMTKRNTVDPAVRDALEGALGQLVTLQVAGIAFEPGDNGGTLARVAVDGGTHEILCELTGDGRLLSARVVEV